MSTKRAVAPRVATADTKAALRRQYGCGPVELTGSPDALYERHLLFDNVADSAAVGARERYEAFARSLGYHVGLPDFPPVVCLELIRRLTSHFAS